MSDGPNAWVTFHQRRPSHHHRYHLHHRLDLHQYQTLPIVELFGRVRQGPTRHLGLLDQRLKHNLCRQLIASRYYIAIAERHRTASQFCIRWEFCSIIIHLYNSIHQSPVILSCSSKACSSGMVSVIRDRVEFTVPNLHHRNFSMVIVIAYDQFNQFDQFMTKCDRQIFRQIIIKTRSFIQLKLNFRRPFILIFQLFSIVILWKWWIHSFIDP